MAGIPLVADPSTKPRPEPRAVSSREGIANPIVLLQRSPSGKGWQRRPSQALGILIASTKPRHTEGDLDMYIQPIVANRTSTEPSSTGRVTARVLTCGFTLPGFQRSKGDALSASGFAGMYVAHWAPALTMWTSPHEST